MTKAIDVLEYINAKASHLDDLQCQKLLYYVQGWALARNGTALFEDKIEACKLGPAVPSVHRRSSSKQPYELTEDQKSIIDVAGG